MRLIAQDRQPTLIRIHFEFVSVKMLLLLCNILAQSFVMDVTLIDIMQSYIKYKVFWCTKLSIDVHNV
jgi:hypothetical protein